MEKIICCVAQLEKFDPKEDFAGCEKCGLKEITHTVDHYGIGFYKASVLYGGGSLEGYQFDDQPYVDLGPEFEQDDYKITYIDDFEHLCVHYNREGNPRVNVVAMDNDTRKKLRPAKLPADGHDAMCPIEKVTVASGIPKKTKPYALEGFPWEDIQQADAYEQGAACGAFSAQPPAVPGDMHITAKDTISDGALYGYKFNRWERNRLSSWIVGMEHQWVEYDRTVKFDQNTFEGLIAYYDRYKLSLGWTPPDTLPQPREDGYPIPKVFRVIRDFVLRLLGLRR